MVKTFIKKPVQIQAVRWTGYNFQEVQEFVGRDILSRSTFPCLAITTLEGTMLANIDDWIIRGVKGEFYPCKPDIFDQTYEEVN